MLGEDASLKLLIIVFIDNEYKATKCKTLWISVRATEITAQFAGVDSLDPMGPFTSGGASIGHLVRSENCPQSEEQ
jgi:hypothetical protein